MVWQYFLTPHAWQYVLYTDAKILKNNPYISFIILFSCIFLFLVKVSSILYSFFCSFSLPTILPLSLTQILFNNFILGWFQCRKKRIQIVYLLFLYFCNRLLINLWTMCFFFLICDNSRRFTTHLLYTLVLCTFS